MGADQRAAFGDLVDLVLGKMKEFVVTRLILAAIEKLASLFTPIGAIVQLVMTIWNIAMFLKDQFDRIVSVLKAIVDTVTDIANGVLDKAAQGVEMALANALPVAIDLVAKLARLGGIPEKIREILGSIRQRVEDAIVNLLKKIGQGFKSFFKGKGGARRRSPAPRSRSRAVRLPSRSARGSMWSRRMAATSSGLQSRAATRR